MNKHTHALQVTLKASNYLKYFIIFLYGLALLASILNTLPLLTRYLLVCLIGLNAYKTWQDLAKQSVSLCHSHARGWELIENNTRFSIEILNSSVITRLAIFLHVKKRNLQATHLINKLLTVLNQSDKTLLIPCDSLKACDYRALIVRLKITANSVNNDLY